MAKPIIFLLSMSIMFSGVKLNLIEQAQLLAPSPATKAVSGKTPRQNRAGRDSLIRQQTEFLANVQGAEGRVIRELDAALESRNLPDEERKRVFLELMRWGPTALAAVYRALTGSPTDLSSEEVDGIANRVVIPALIQQLYFPLFSDQEYQTLLEKLFVLTARSNSSDWVRSLFQFVMDERVDVGRRGEAAKLMYTVKAIVPEILPELMGAVEDPKTDHTIATSFLLLLEEYDGEIDYDPITRILKNGKISYFRKDEALRVLTARAGEEYLVSLLPDPSIERSIKRAIILGLKEEGNRDLFERIFRDSNQNPWLRETALNRLLPTSNDYKVALVRLVEDSTLDEGGRKAALSLMGENQWLAEEYRLIQIIGNSKASFDERKAAQAQLKLGFVSVYPTELLVEHIHSDAMDDLGARLLLRSFLPSRLEDAIGLLAIFFDPEREEAIRREAIVAFSRFLVTSDPSLSDSARGLLLEKVLRQEGSLFEWILSLLVQKIWDPGLDIQDRLGIDRALYFLVEAFQSARKGYFQSTEFLEILARQPPELQRALLAEFAVYKGRVPVIGGKFWELGSQIRYPADGQQLSIVQPHHSWHLLYYLTQTMQGVAQISVQSDFFKDIHYISFVDFLSNPPVTLQDPTQRWEAGSQTADMLDVSINEQAVGPIITEPLVNSRTIQLKGQYDRAVGRVQRIDFIGVADIQWVQLMTYAAAAFRIKPEARDRVETIAAEGWGEARQLVRQTLSEYGLETVLKEQWFDEGKGRQRPRYERRFEEIQPGLQTFFALSAEEREAIRDELTPPLVRILSRIEQELWVEGLNASFNVQQLKTLIETIQDPQAQNWVARAYLTRLAGAQGVSLHEYGENFLMRSPVTDPEEQRLWMRALATEPTPEAWRILEDGLSRRNAGVAVAAMDAMVHHLRLDWNRVRRIELEIQTHPPDQAKPYLLVLQRWVLSSRQGREWLRKTVRRDGTEGIVSQIANARFQLDQRAVQWQNEFQRLVSQMLGTNFVEMAI